MFARIILVRVHEPSEAARYMKEVYVPNSERQEGFRGFLGCFNEDGNLVVADIYDTVDQIRATETQGWFQDMVEGYGEGKLKGQVRRNFYEVALHTKV